MNPFRLKSDYNPAGDQPKAIEQLVKGLKTSPSAQTLLGVTGSGKTYTVANVIQQVQKPTLVLAHNKTLAAQLYNEFKAFFPENAVGYFVSYYDYYQPEAYLAQTDTYIEKDATINDEIESALSAPLAGVSDIMSGAFKVKDILSSTSDMFRSVGGLVGCNQANSNCVGQVKKWKIGSGPSKLMDIKGAFDNITKNANSVSAGGKSFSRPDCSTPSFCGPPVVNIFGGDGFGGMGRAILGNFVSNVDGL